MNTNIEQKIVCPTEFYPLFIFLDMHNGIF